MAPECGSSHDLGSDIHAALGMLRATTVKAGTIRSDEREQCYEYAVPYLCPLHSITSIDPSKMNCVIKNFTRQSMVVA